METRANYVAIGLFVVFVIAALLGALYWLYRSSQSGATEPVRIIFPEPVTGLSAGGSVLFNGIKVGEVAQLNFAPEGGDNVIALTRINPNAPIKTDTVAKLGFQGLTGVAYISLTGGTEAAQSLFGQADGKVPTIEAATSAFTNVLDSAQSVLQRVNTTLNDVNSFLQDNRGKLDTVVDNVTQMTTTLNNAAPQVSGLITDIASASREVAAAAPQIGSVVSRANTLLDAVDPTEVTSIIANVNSFTGTLPQIGEDARGVVGSVRGLVTRLDDVAGTLGEAVQAVESVVTSIDKGAIDSIVNNVQTTMNVIAEHATALGTTIDNVTKISQDFSEISGSLVTRRPEIETAIDDATAMIADARKAVATAAPTLEKLGDAFAGVTPERVNKIIGDVENIASGFAEQLPALNSFITSATTAATSIADVSSLIAKRSDVINTALTDAAELLKNLNQASTNAPQIMVSLQEQLDHVGTIVAAVDPAAIGTVVRNVTTFTDMLARESGNIGTLITDASGAAKEINTLASDLTGRLPDLEGLIDDTRATVQSAKAFTDTLPAMAEALKPGVENVSAALQAIDPAALGEIVDNANRIAATIAAQDARITSIITAADGTAQRIEAIASAFAIHMPQIGEIIENADAAAKSAQVFAAELPAFAESLKPGVDNVAAVMQAIDPASIEGLVSNASSFVEGLAEQRQPLADLIASVGEAAKQAADLGTALNEKMPEVRSVIDDASAAAGNVREVSERLPGIVSSIEPGIANAGDALAALSPDDIAQIQRDAAAFTSALASQREAIEALIQSASGASVRVEAIASALAQRMPQIGAMIDSAEGSVTAVRTFADALPGFADTLRPGIQNISDALSAIEPGAIRSIVDDAASLASTLAAEGETIRRILSEADTAAQRAREVIAAVAEKSPEITSTIDRVSATMASAELAAADARRFTESLPALLDEIRPGIANANSVLLAIDAEAVTEIVDSVRQVSNTLSDARGNLESVLNTAGNVARQVETVTTAVSSRVDQISNAIDNVAAFSRDLAQAGPSIDSIVTSARGALDAVQNTVSAINAEAINEIVTNLQRVSVSIGSRVGEIGDAIDNASNAAKGLSEGLGTIGGADGTLSQILDQAKRIGNNLENASSQVNLVVGRAGELLDGPVQGLVANVSSAAADVRDVAAAFASRAGGIASGLSRFSQSGLDDLRAVINQGRSTLSAIETAVTSFDRDPSRVIYGGSNAPTYKPQRR